MVLVGVYKREVESLLHAEVLVNLISWINRERHETIAEVVTVVARTVFEYGRRVRQASVVF